MEYVGIAFIVVTIAIFCLYKISNKILGLSLRLKPLIWCGVCAVFISVVLPRIVVSITGFIGMMSVLALFAVIFAYFVAYYDDVHENTEQVGIMEIASQHEIILKNNEANDQSVNLLLPIKKTEPPAVTKTSAMEIEESENILSATEEPKQEISLKSDAESFPETEQPVVFETGVLEIKERENMLSTTIMPEQEVSPEPECDSFIETDHLAEAEANIIMKTEKSENMFEAAKESEQEASSRPDSDSLEDLLNFAFAQKEQNHFHSALEVFMRAYKRYHDNEVAPFLVVEIGNILKYKGFYDEAINIFIEGRNLPVLKDQQTFEQEFVNTIAYLRIIKNVLLQNHMDFVPFLEIPSRILEEIDREFQDWRNLA